MKSTYSIILILIGSLILVSCNATSPDDQEFAAESPFSMEYPEWDDKSSNDPLNIVSRIRGDNQCYFDLNAAPVPLKQYREIVKDYMKEQKVTILSSDPLRYEFQIPDSSYFFAAKTRGLDCGDKSYLATITCLKENYDETTATRVFDSMQCDDGG